MISGLANEHTRRITMEQVRALQAEMPHDHWHEGLDDADVALALLSDLPRAKVAECDFMLIFGWPEVGHNAMVSAYEWAQVAS